VILAANFYVLEKYPAGMNVYCHFDTALMPTLDDLERYIIVTDASIIFNCNAECPTADEVHI
jgi:hypothetical protein